MIHIKLLHQLSKNKIKKNCIAKNTYVHVDIDELNDILSTNINTENDEDEGIKQLQFNKEDDGHEDDKDSD